MRKIGLACALALAACTPEATTSASGGAGGVFRLERFCAAEGLAPSMRHTYLLIDEHVLTKAETPADFASLNAKVRDVVVAFADPGGATLSGATDYRERLSVFLLPASGSAAKLLFEGCLPALSPEELSAANSEGSSVSNFFTGGVQQQLSNEAEQFRSRVISALVLAARTAAGEAAPETNALPQTRLVESLRASGRIIDGEKGLPRVVLLSNLARVDIGETATREAVRTRGFAEGQESALDLGRAEMHVFLVDGQRAALARDYVQAFFLAQHANVLTWADDSPPAMPPAPVSVSRFNGEAGYPSGAEAIQLRIAADRNGALVNSWLVLRGSPNRSTPLSGQQTCDSPGTCRISNDDGGFAQVWTAAPGGEPTFDNELPFGGLRDVELTITDARLTGRVFDPAVSQIGPTPGNDSIGLTGRVAEGATF